MTAEPVPTPVCTLCGSALTDVGRCSVCGLVQDGPGRPDPFTTPVRLALGAVFVAVYAIALFVVLLAR